MHELTASEILNKFEKRSLTSETLLRNLRERIRMLEPDLNALADFNHQAINEARACDLARTNGTVKGPLHGIPVLIKDNVFTNDAMRTTANSYAFQDFFAPYDATIVEKLRAAGAIILSKANCSEFAYFMSMGTMPSGYGSMHGQVVHPYDKTMDPLGSSTGSAVGVAAGYAPLAIGTETFGSLISPAKANSIVTIKPTLGLVSRHGIIPISTLQDTAGPMARTVKDAAILLDVIKGKDPHDRFTDMIPDSLESFSEACERPIKDRRIGVLRFKDFTLSDEEKELIQEAKRLFTEADVEVIDIEEPYELDNSLLPLIYEFKRDLNHFLSQLRGLLPVDSLAGLIKFNQANESRTLKYGQTHFYQSNSIDQRLTAPDYLKTREKLTTATEKFAALFRKHNIDALITTQVNGYPPVGGLPAVAVPAKALRDKQPQTMLFIGEAFCESKILPFANHYEQKTRKRIAPRL